MSEPLTLTPIALNQRGTLSNLFQLYAYDFSEVVSIAVGHDGRFAVDCEHWLGDPGRSAFLIHVGDELAGFALVQRGSQLREDPDVMDVGEFFVLRYLRRRGLGKRAARAVFERFPGRWEVRVRVANQHALAFWSDIVAAVAQDRFSVLDWRNHDVDWRVFSFDAK